jgi:putative ABC transport system permease protein
LLVGVLVTVASAIAPAVRASRVAPVAALRDVAAEPPAPSARRLVRGMLLVAAGAALLSVGLFAHVGNRGALTGAGLVAVFLGISVLGPFAVRPVIGPLGMLMTGRGAAGHAASGRIGYSNAMRNPSRTATTASALMVGMALVSVMTVLAQSLRASTESIIDDSVHANYVISSGAAIGSGSGLSPVLERQLAVLPQVATVAGVRGGVAQVFGGTTAVVATQPAASASLVNIGVTQGDLASMTNAGIAVSTQVASAHKLRIGSPVAVTFPASGTRTYTVQAIYGTRAAAGNCDYVLPMPAAVQNFPQALDIEIFVGLQPGIGTSSARAAISTVVGAYPNASLMDEAQFKAQQEQQVNTLLDLVYALLALAVLIALIGIANTLALSIYERTREIGLLRAVGTTRGQLRAMVRSEALVISLFGAVEGLVLGTLFGWAVVTAMRSAGTGVTRLAVPVPQLIVLTVLASLAGLVAAIIPSRHAARLNILQAVTTD